MFALIVISVFILIISIIVYFEYKNEKNYREEREKRSEDRKKTQPELDIKKKANYVVEPRKVPSAKTLKEAEEKKRLEEQKRKEQKQKEQKQKEEKLAKQKLEQQKAEEVRKKQEQQKAEEARKKQEETSKPEPTVDIPECKYPEFNFSRLLKMGLSEDEAIEFAKELIPQIKTQIPLIKEAMEKEDFHTMERLTHSIKGSSTTVGTGGVSDLLVDFNTYLKTGKDLAVTKAYLKHLEYYSKALEEAYA